MKQANETISFEGLEFRLRRVPRRKTMTITMKPTSISTVSVSLGCGIDQIIEFLEEKRAWILAAKRRFEKQGKTQQQIVIEPGARIPILGRELQIRFYSEAGRKLKVSSDKDHLLIGVPQRSVQLDTQRLRAAVQNYLKVSAEILLGGRTRYWAQKMSLFPKKLSFRNQKSRWGSCNSRGAIGLNIKLICVPPQVADYVIVHELAHLKHLNHSKYFWETVEHYCPWYQDSKKWLKENAGSFSFLDSNGDC